MHQFLPRTRWTLRSCRVSIRALTPRASAVSPHTRWSSRSFSRNLFSQVHISVSFLQHWMPCFFQSHNMLESDFNSCKIKCRCSAVENMQEHHHAPFSLFSCWSVSLSRPGYSFLRGPPVYEPAAVGSGRRLRTSASVFLQQPCCASWRSKERQRGHERIPWTIQRLQRCVLFLLAPLVSPFLHGMVLNSLC